MSVVKASACKPFFAQVFYLTAINIICFVFYGMFICGCHFHIEALIFSLIPIIVNILGIHEGIKKKEKKKIFIWSALLALWLTFAWVSNITFYFNPLAIPK